MKVFEQIQTSVSAGSRPVNARVTSACNHKTSRISRQASHVPQSSFNEVIQFPIGDFQLIPKSKTKTWGGASRVDVGQEADGAPRRAHCSCIVELQSLAHKFGACTKGQAPRAVSYNGGTSSAVLLREPSCRSPPPSPTTPLRPQ